MPPKKTKRAPAAPLTGCTITFASNAIPADQLSGNSLAWAKDEISNKGGQYSAKVEECTHLVVTEAQFNKSLTKVQKAQSQHSSVNIVSYDWLETTLTSGSRADEKDYGFANAGTAAANGSTKKDKDGDAESDSGDAKGSVSKKRKRDSKSDVKTDLPERSHGNGKQMNVTKKLDMNIPLDDCLQINEGGSWKVHIDDDSNIFDVTLNQSDSKANANKFYRMQLVVDKGTWKTWTRWGRVGEDGQMKLLGDGSFDNALSEFHKKFKDKTGNAWEDRATGPIKPKKYVFIERSYEDSDSEGEDELPGADKRQKVKKEDSEEDTSVLSKLEPAVQDLMKLIFNKDYFDQTFSDFDYDARKMPLGKLSKNSLLRGYEVLKTLAGIVNAPNNSRSEIETLSNQYLSLIPHVVSRSSRPPVLDTFDKVKKELELLEALTDMQLANDLMKSASKNKKDAEEIALLDRQFSGLGLDEMSPLAKNGAEYKNLEAYLTKSVGHTHGTKYQVQEIFRIVRNGEYDRFEKSEYAKISNKNRRLLWHGSRTTNYGGILSQGLRIAPPEAPVSGYMFGKGVYLADMSSKSANYCASYSSGGTGLLLLCEAELGEPPLKLVSADYNAGDKVKQENKLSTWGVGRTAPKAWQDAGAVHKSLAGISMPDVVSTKPGDTNENGAYLQYNEYIVYDVAQIKLRYLFRVSM